jgi:nucleoside-diphosphate-sugar epimerase
MKVLVMGGTQFNGFALVRELVRTGHDVTILNRGKTEAPLPRSVRRLICDRTDPSAMNETLAGLDFDCIHDISAYRPEDVQGMVELFRGRCGHYIFASSTVIYAASDRLPFTESHAVDRSDAQNEYGLNKLLCEDILVREHRENGFPGSVVAFSMVFGPRNIIPDREQRMFMRLYQGRRVLIPGDGTTVGQVGHVDDEARALCAMMQNPKTFGRRYNLTGGDCYTDEGYVDTFAEVVGVVPEKVFIPAETMEDLWAGRIEVSGGPIQVNVDIRSKQDERGRHLFQLQRLIQRLAPHLHHWNRSVFFSIDQLKQDTGWRPEYTFQSAALQTWEWMQHEGLHETRDFDFGFEDDLLARLEASEG